MDQIHGPQTLLAQLTQFQPADTPERLEAFLSRLRAYGPYMDAHIDIMADGLRSGRTAARIVADRTIEQLRADARDPDRAGDRPGDGAGGERRGPRARPRRRARGRLPGGPASASRRSRGRTTRRPGSVPGLVVGARRRHAVPPRDPALDVARPGARGRSTRSGLDELASINDERRAIAAVARASATTSHAYRRKLVDRPGEPGADAGGAGRARDRGHRPGRRGRAARVRPPPARRAARSRPVEAFKEKDAPFAYYFPPTIDGVAPRHLLRQHLRPAEPDVLEARLDDLPRGHPRPPLPDQPRDGAPGPQRVPAARRARRRRRLSSRAGACTPSAWPTSSACTGRRPSGSGCSTRRRGGRRGSSSTPGMHALRLVAPAVDRLAARHGPLGRPTRRSRPTATSAWPGQALTYMTGMREIRRLRHELEARDGARFDLKRFHDEVHRPRLPAAGDADPRAAALGHAQPLIRPRPQWIGPIAVSRRATPRHSPGSRRPRPGR